MCAPARERLQIKTEYQYQPTQLGDPRTVGRATALPVLARNGHADSAARCPLSGPKRTYYQSEAAAQFAGAQGADRTSSWTSERGTAAFVSASPNERYQTEVESWRGLQSQ